MPQSFDQLYVHLIFSTKHREHLISADIQSELYAYIGGVIKNIGCIPIQIGGTSDHIHILCTLSKKITLIKLLEEVKRSSSRWIKTKGDVYSNFYWQDGYGAFSIGHIQTQDVIKYIAEQDNHHQKISFQDEYRQFLKKYKIEYDERYVWD